MKSYILSIFLFSLFSSSGVNQVKQLPLLIPNKNFRTEILDCVYKDRLDSSNVVMLGIHKNNVQNEKDNYELRVTTLTLKEFAFFSFIEDKYLGYFEYRSHLVLVYGDDNTKHFFSNTNVIKEFDFLPLKPNDYKNKPPVSLEPIAFIYNFKNGQFNQIDSGVLGFFH
jgi:hypothetical protein